MITLVEALRFRALKYVRQPLGALHVLAGPNASGKTTFLDVVALLGRLVSEGVEPAITERSDSLQDMVWFRRGESFELAIEARIPPERASLNPDYPFVRYETALGIDPETRELAILSEKLLLKVGCDAEDAQPALFPQSAEPPASILTAKGAKGVKTVIHKAGGGNDHFYDETGRGWDHVFRLGPRKSALGNLPDDDSKFPSAAWLKNLLRNGVQRFVLNSQAICKPSPPGQARGLKTDGSNLPWVVSWLEREEPERFARWLEHVRRAMPDLQGIRAVERELDKHRYLVICYRGGLEVPSWMEADGTLRLLALTLPAFLPDAIGVYLIEEPENGIHPRAVETMFQALAAVPRAQVLVTTHSPVILNVVDAERVLCFGKTPEGATDIVAGSRHPALRDRRGKADLGVWFAGGVLG